MHIKLSGPALTGPETPRIREFDRTYSADVGLSEYGIVGTPRPKHTFSTNNGTLAWVDSKNELHLSISTKENEQILKDEGYAEDSWGVPGSNAELPQFNEWKAREYALDRMNRAAQLPIPNIPVNPGKWSTSTTLLEPGEYAYDSKHKTIAWYCQNYPTDGGHSVLVLTSPYSAENIQALKAAGYKEGVSDIALRADLDKWMQGLQK